MRRALGTYGTVETVTWDEPERSWRVRFTSQEAVEAATSAATAAIKVRKEKEESSSPAPRREPKDLWKRVRITVKFAAMGTRPRQSVYEAEEGESTARDDLWGATAVIPYYNETPYEARGWGTCESELANEAFKRAQKYNNLHESLVKAAKLLPPKIVEIDELNEDPTKTTNPIMLAEERIKMAEEKLRAAEAEGVRATKQAESELAATISAADEDIRKAKANVGVTKDKEIAAEHAVDAAEDELLKADDFLNELPEGWETQKDSKGKIYYENHITGARTYAKPGWNIAKDERGKPYYFIFNRETGETETRWEKPTRENDGLPPSPEGSASGKNAASRAALAKEAHAKHVREAAFQKLKDKKAAAEAAFAAATAAKEAAQTASDRCEDKADKKKAAAKKKCETEKTKAAEVLAAGRAEAIEEKRVAEEDRAAAVEEARLAAEAAKEAELKRRGETASARVQRVTQGIKSGAFSVDEDRQLVLDMYESCVTRIIGALAYAHGGLVDFEYEGERNAAGRAEGWGTCIGAEGTIYEGEWKNGKQEGRGTTRSASGEMYRGEFKAGKRDGKGTMRYANGGEYKGEWVAGEMVGKGVYTFAEGHEYDGVWKANQFDGTGTMRWADGEIDISLYKAGLNAGEGMRWRPTWKDARKLLDGQVVGKCPLGEARKIAEACGVQIPIGEKGFDSLIKRKKAEGE